MASDWTRVRTTMELLRGWLPLIRVTRKPSCKKCRSFPGKIKKSRWQHRNEFVNSAMNPELHMHKFQHGKKWKKKNEEKRQLAGSNSCHHIIHLGKRKRWKRNWLVQTYAFINSFTKGHRFHCKVVTWSTEVTSSAQSKCQLMYSFDRPFPCLSGIKLTNVRMP